MNLQLLSYAEVYYQLNGFQKITVPWTVEQGVSDLTKPPERKNDLLDTKALVGSAEQSYLQLLIDKQLKPGLYVTTTPCFRDEKVFDKYHQRYFLKTELINTKTVDSQNLKELCQTALNFFSQYIKVKLIETDTDQYDIVDQIKNIELGSYGIRKITYQGQEISWIYGTGCAEPRLSKVIDDQKKTGYHQDKTIPKNKVGDILKIFEETHELQDAVLQKQNLLILCELADLYGSIDLYLKQNFKGIRTSDLKDMSRLTAKAFKVGIR